MMTSDQPKPPPARHPARPTSELSLTDVIKGQLAWVVNQLVGFVVCLPLAVELAIKTLLRWGLPLVQQWGVGLHRLAH